MSKQKSSEVKVIFGCGCVAYEPRPPLLAGDVLEVTDYCNECSKPSLCDECGGEYYYDADRPIGCPWCREKAGD